MRCWSLLEIKGERQWGSFNLVLEILFWLLINVNLHLNALYMHCACLYVFGNVTTFLPFWLNCDFFFTDAVFFPQYRVLDDSFMDCFHLMYSWVLCKWPRFSECKYQYTWACSYQLYAVILKTSIESHCVPQESIELKSIVKNYELKSALR